MAKRRISKENIQNRLLSLQAVYGLKGLSKLLNISTTTSRNYRIGKTNPNELTYGKINKLFNKTKTKINTPKVQSKIEKLKTPRITKPTPQYVPIYPQYMYKGQASEFSDVSNYSDLEELHEQGYVAGYMGGKQIPAEVQFLIKGEKLNRFGKTVYIKAVVSNQISPKAENNYRGNETKIMEFEYYSRFIKGFKKETPPLERLEILREYVMGNAKIARGYVVSILGFYFREDDEV